MRSVVRDLAMLLSLLAYLLVATVDGVALGAVDVLRPVVGVLVLGFLPGYVLLAALRRGARGTPVRTLLYSVGLSVPIAIVLGLAVNFALRFAGARRPLTATSLATAFGLSLLALTVWYHVRSGPGAPPLLTRPPVPSRRGRAVVFLGLLPVFTAIATVALPAPLDRSTLLAVIVVLAAVPALLVWDVLSEDLAPLAVLAVALAVLYHTNLVSDHIWGHDIHFQYYAANLVVSHGYWAPDVQVSSVSLVSVTFLPSVYSIVTGLELVWVYKAVYPLLVSLLPLGVWQLSRDQFTDERIATLAPFVLVFYYGFFKDMPGKQFVAELFAVLLLVAALDEELPVTHSRAFAILFGATMVVSHYGVSLVVLGVLAGTAGLLVVARELGIVRGVSSHIARPTVVAVLVLFWINWFAFTAVGLNFERVVATAAETLASLLASGGDRTGADYATSAIPSLLWGLYRGLYVVLMGLLAVGVARSGLAVLRGEGRNRALSFTRVGGGRSTDGGADAPAERSSNRAGAVQSTPPRLSDPGPVDVEYVLLSACTFGFLLASVALTFGMGFDRTLHIALIVLAPFPAAAVGVGRRASQRLVDVSIGDLRLPSVPQYGSFALFLAVLFLFSSGAAFVAGGQAVPPYSIGLNESAGWPVYGDDEVAATRWLDANDEPNATVAVYNRWQSSIKSRDALLVSELYDSERLVRVWENRTTLPGSTYVYVSDRPMVVEGSDRAYIDPDRTPFHAEVVSAADRIYDSGHAAVYRTSGQTAGRNAGAA